MPVDLSAGQSRSRRPGLSGHGAQCHNEQAATAMALFSGLFLDGVDVANLARDTLVWEKVA